MEIELWTDVACPFCYLGERQLTLALESFPHRDEVTVVPRSFELDPTATRGEHHEMHEALAAKFGTTRAQVQSLQEGIAERAREVDLPFDTTDAVVTNTFDAHRLVHLARESDLDRELLRALMQGYFATGLRAGDHDALTAVATEVGLDEARVREVLASEEYADAVRADETRAREVGVTGVPFFLIDEKYAVSGAQSVEGFKGMLTDVWGREHPTT